ncbi:hypothetical protein UG55_1027118 [Frankia sp. EI5c]|uniref:hypothetical protein n=1 Tax=Frankia sp. EI5c TaxID=683316 RepID=UPI0007C35228|nr:hypothetical protein [Frankia sp. EI5c]OAA25010.1 hypothetical protein UG55_1027118 [Frankia sp. EI5c]
MWSALVFLCRAEQAEALAETDEATAVEWLTAAEVEGRSVPAFAVRVTDALAGHEEPVLRHHDGIHLLGADAPPPAGRPPGDPPPPPPPPPAGRAD